MRFKFGPIDFTQPSTWRGIAGGVAVFGLSFSPELTEQIAIALGAFLSAIELFRNEHKPAPVHIQLPPIELIGKPDTGGPAGDSGAAADQRVQQPVRPRSNTVEAADHDGTDLPVGAVETVTLKCEWRW